MYRYILFDFDGTIADSAAVVERNLRLLCGKYGFHKLSYEEFKPGAALSLPKKFCLYWFLRKIEREFKKLYLDNISSIRMFDQIAEVLSLLHAAGYPLVILSSNTVSNIQAFLKHNRISLGIVVLSSKGLYGKHKAIRRFLSEHDCAPDQLLYVGDEFRDIRACKRAGVDMAFVTWGLDGNKDVSHLKPTYILSSPEELLPIAFAQ